MPWLGKQERLNGFSGDLTVVAHLGLEIVKLWDVDGWD